MTTIIPEITCNICLETKTEIRKDRNGGIKCYTCQEGFVCDKCMCVLDPEGTLFSKDIDYIHKVIKCACCRTLNWNYHYNQIMCQIIDCEQYLNEYGLYDLKRILCEDYEDNKVIDLFIRNVMTAKEIEYELEGEEIDCPICRKILCIENG